MSTEADKFRRMLVPEAVADYGLTVDLRMLADEYPLLFAAEIAPFLPIHVTSVIREAVDSVPPEWASEAARALNDGATAAADEMAKALSEAAKEMGAAAAMVSDDLVRQILDAANKPGSVLP